MADHKNVLVLGASFAGLTAAHYFLKHIRPALPGAGAAYNLTLVNPSVQWFARPAAPRACINDTLMPDSKTFLPIADGFAQYDKETFTFVLGRATALDTAARTATITLKDGGEEVINYYALIIATGTRTFSPVMGLTTDEDVLHASLAAFRTALPSAKDIVIAGGGPVGVEVAGEIGDFLNGAAGLFSSRPANPKATITLVAGSEKLLPKLRPGLAQKAEKFLNRVGVDVVYGVRVERVSPETSGRTAATVVNAAGQKTTVTLSNGATMDCDIYIPAMGWLPNTDFLDPRLLNAKRYLQTNDATLRVDAAGPRVYGFGDVASYAAGGVLDIYSLALPVLAANLKRDLLADAQGGEMAAAPAGKDRLYVASTKETHLVPVGRSKGVGALFGWKLPSFMVWAIKGRDYFVSQAPPVQNGSKYKKEIKWSG